MSDDKTNRGKQDRIRINIHQDFEARVQRAWDHAEELKDMVQQLGPSADAIRQAVKRKSKSAGA